MSLILLALMLAAAGLAIALKPTVKFSSHSKAINLEQMVPESFGNWRIDANGSALVVNPQQQELLDKIYSQTLSRTYIHTSGRRIMLSLAYGNNQSHDTQIHKPEVCYPAQGFQLISTSKDQVQTADRSLPVMRVLTRLGQRQEPVTYWMRVGDEVVRGAIEQNITRVSMGLQGVIPDGLLFRVSEISADPKDSFALQDSFINQFLSSIPRSEKYVFVGASVASDSGS